MDNNYKTKEEKQKLVDKVNGVKETLGTAGACKKYNLKPETYYRYTSELKRAGQAKIVTYNGTQTVKRVRNTRPQKTGQLALVMGTTEQIGDLLRGFK